MFQKTVIPFQYYATKVEHEITLWGGFFSVLHGERGEFVSGKGTYRPELDLKGTAT